MGVTGATLRLGVRWFVPSLLLAAGVACALLLFGTTTAHADEDAAPADENRSTNTRTGTAESVGGLAALEPAGAALRDVSAAASGTARDPKASARELTHELVTKAPVVAPHSHAATQSQTAPATTGPTPEEHEQAPVADVAPPVRDAEPEEEAKSSTQADVEEAGTAAEVTSAVAETGHEVQEAVADRAPESAATGPVRETGAAVARVQDEASAAVSEIADEARSAAASAAELVPHADALGSPLPAPDLEQLIAGLTGTVENTLLDTVAPTTGGVMSPAAVLVDTLELPHPPQTVLGTSDHAVPADEQRPRDHGGRDTTGGTRQPETAYGATAEGSANHLADPSGSLSTRNSKSATTRSQAATRLRQPAQHDPPRGSHGLGTIAGVSTTSSAGGGYSPAGCLNASCSPPAGHLEEPTQSAAWLWPGSRTILPGFAPD